MSIRLNPYLNFRDSTREAMEFYQAVFGGELTLSTFAEFQASQDPAEQEKIMHSMLTTENGLVLMAADLPNAMDLPASNATISLSGGQEDDATLRRYWDRLSGSGSVTEPLAVAPWGDAFGMCTDKFGVNWLVNIAGA